MKNQIAIILSLGMVISSIIIGIFFYETKKQVNTVRVVGYSSGEYDSDVLIWNITLAANSGPSNLSNGYQSLNNDIKKIRIFLDKKGLDTKELSIKPSWNYANYNRDGVITGHIFEQTVSLTLKQPSKFNEVEELATDMTELIATGVSLKNSIIEYYISALPEVKKEIISEATKDARERALQVASTTNTKLGKILNGRVGVFQITEPLSTEVQSYGIYNTHTKKKQISVTINCEFELK